MKTVPKLWGLELWLVNEPEYCLKELVLDPDTYCSIHRHPIKKETFRVVTGLLRLEVESYDRTVQTFTLHAGQTYTIYPRQWHRFSSQAGATFQEVSTHHDDADVERLLPSGRGKPPPWPARGPDHL